MNEMPKVCNTIYRKARKLHKCCGCLKIIKVGEKYRYTSGIWYEPNSYKHCLSCDYVIDNYRLMDNSLEPEDGPSLELGGVEFWFKDFLCKSWNGEEAISDLSKLFNLPEDYFRRLIG